MIQDALLQLSLNQLVGNTAFSTNTIDLSEKRDIGEGEDLQVEFDCTASAVASGTVNVNFQIVASDNANLSSPVVLAQSDAIPSASLVAGYREVLKMPPQIASLGHRYVGVQYLFTGGGTLTAGTFSAYVVKDVGDPTKFYPGGFTVF